MMKSWFKLFCVQKWLEAINRCDDLTDRYHIIIYLQLLY